MGAGEGGVRDTSGPTLFARNDPRTQGYYTKVRRIVLIVALALVALIVFFVLTWSRIFAIKTIETTTTRHITNETISSLAAIPEGSTLFGIDQQAIIDRIESNPWVKEVTLRRHLPDRLEIAVTERTESLVVMLSNGVAAWRLSQDGYWIEAIAMEEDSSTSPLEQARTQAEIDGAYLVTETAATVSPRAGDACTDDAVNGALTYSQELPAELLARIAYFKAPSLQAISAVLDTGVEVSLGAPIGDTMWKGQVALSLLSQYSGLATYVNVRTPDTPTWRGLDPNTATVEGDGTVRVQNEGVGEAGEAAPDEGQAATGEGETAEVVNDPLVEPAPTEPAATDTAGLAEDTGMQGEVVDETAFYQDDAYVEGEYVDEGYYDEGYYDEGYYDDGYYDEGYYDESYDESGEYY